VTWTRGQCRAILLLGGKAVLGEGCLASCDSLRRTLAFWAAEKT
jgi:hypothetical protein